MKPNTGWLELSLTGAALTEDYRAVWTDPSNFAQLPEIIEQVGTDKQKIAAHFENDSAKIESFVKDRIAFEKYNMSKDYLEAVEQAQTDAERVTTLASAETRIPASGAITLLRNDPKTQGPKLFAKHCAGCHTHTAPGDDGGESRRDKKSSAPNLIGFASRDWMKSLLDPKQIAGANYFGNTSHREGDMVGFVKETLKDWPAEEVQNVVIALSAEAGLKCQTTEDSKDAARIEAGRKLISQAERCVQCHKFHDVGQLGLAPDLTGYGSREWLVGMISNPKHERFYGDNNDRMPSFAQQPGDSPANMLPAHSIGLLVDWLRGEWYEPQVNLVNSSTGAQ